MFNKKILFITGGTGSFGKKFISYIFSNYKPNQVIVYSRDELKQFEMRSQFPSDVFPIKYTIGDVRDKERLIRSMYKADFVVHSAAMKQVPTAEFNPSEAIKTNINGALNVVESCLDNNVNKVIALSTDKACSPINLYGATKLASDKIFAAANNYHSSQKTKFSVVRYGNVAGSRGSVIPFFLSKKKDKFLPITDVKMTRFWITLDEGVQFVINSFSDMIGGELFIPKIPSTKIIDLAKAIAPKAKFKIIGIRPGEKIHEYMISVDDALNTVEFKNHYVIQPAHPWWDNIKYKKIKGGKKVTSEFSYSSNNNNQWLNEKQIKKMIKSFE
tara:strand:+ start:1504 stop:2490 length:987 start_codon:yes stop_codon:yes gene_type:complete